MTLTEIVKDNKVTFDSYRQGTFYYNVITKDGSYQFTVPTDDVGAATLLAEDKAIFYMRWIRKAIEDNTLTKL